MKRLLIIILLFPVLAYAMPEKFEVWFLSTVSSAKLHTPNLKNLVATSRLQCQPMGDLCFDPQVGLYKRDSGGKVAKTVDNSIIENKKEYDFVDPAASLDRDLIDCEKGNFFDVFCGKAKGSKSALTKQVPLEVWIDVSSTMRQVDWNGFDKQCYRESFLELLNQSCPMNQKMKVYYFTGHRKEAGSFDRVCMSEGLNDMKKLMRDVRASKAKRLIIITDIFEASESFLNEIERTGKASVKGVDNPLFAKDIKRELGRVRKYCSVKK